MFVDAFTITIMVVSLYQVKYHLCFALKAVYTILSISSIFQLKLLETDERIEQL